MKRFSQMLIILCGLMIFAAPVGVSLQSPSNSQSQGVSIESTALDQKFGISLDVQVANAAFVEADCSNTNVIWCGVKTALLEVFELIWFTITQFLAAITAVIVDFFLVHSISSSSYTSGLIEAGWEILRDFVNIVFIFALLVIAFNMVLGRKKSDSKGMLIKTLLVALVLNFSLFVSYAVIDASNIFAHLFYDRIETTGEAYAQVEGEESAQSLSQFFKGLTGTKSPSIAILSTFNPQKILTASTEGGNNPGFFERVIIIFFAGAINILICYIFISVALLFLGRTVGLILLGIFAPLAFATLMLPGATNIKWIGFTTWWKQLLSLAFTAPIYLFLLYLTVRFATNEGVLASIANIGGGGGVINSILSVVLPFALVGILLMTALKVTKHLAGELGGMVVNAAKKGIGGAVAVGAIAATGGAAIAGGVLRGAGAVTGGKFGKGMANTGKSLQATNFNFAQTRLGKFTSKQTGINMGENLGNLSYARAETAAYRTGGAMARAVDDKLSGKPSKAVTEWQDNIRAERDKTIANRIENEQRKAIKDSGLKDKLSDVQAKKARQTTEEAKQEKERVKNEKNEIQKDINREQEELKILNDRIKENKKKIQNASSPQVATALRYQVQSDQNKKDNVVIKIDDLKEKQNDVDKTTLNGQIKEIQKDINKVENDARSAVLKNEGVIDSKGNRVFSKKGQANIRTDDKDAARVASGDIKTSPQVGKGKPDKK